MKSLENHEVGISEWLSILERGVRDVRFWLRNPYMGSGASRFFCAEMLDTIADELKNVARELRGLNVVCITDARKKRR